MLVEAVGHFLQAEPRVLEADLLADGIERQRRKAPVHFAQHARQHGAVAHAGVEHAHRGRRRMQVGELQADAAGDGFLLAAGVDEQQIFLAVVEEAEIAGGRISLRKSPLRTGVGGSDPQQRPELGRRDRRLDTPGRQEIAHPFQGFGSNPRPVAQTGHELAVIDCPAPERRFRHVGPAAEFGNAVQQPDGFLHPVHSLQRRHSH
jgi:hypothetical protein